MNSNRIEVKWIIFIQTVKEAQFGVMKLLGNMLRAHPDTLRCNTTASCLELVKKDSSVYIQVETMKHNLF